MRGEALDSDIMKELEEHLNYSFQNKELLVQALTHTSFANEAHSGHLGSNERLEFLGDAVLELVSSDFFTARRHSSARENSQSSGQVLSASRHSPIARSRFRSPRICCSEEVRR